MKGKRYITVLLATAMLLGLCACGATPTQPTPTPSAAPATAEPTAAPTPELSEKLRETVLGYAAEEIPTPAWIQELGVCDIYNDTFYMAANTDSGAGVVSFDTRTEQFHKYDVDVSALHNPHINAISVAENSIWLYVAEQWTVEECEQGLFTGETNLYILYKNTSSGEQSISPMTFWKSNLPPLYLLALDNNRALIGNHECEPQTYLIDSNANVIDMPDTVVRGMGVRAWVNDKLYVQTADGLAELNRDTLTFGAPVEEIYNQPAVYSSSCGHFLTTIDNVFYSVDAATGEKTEIFEWMDVALALSRLYGTNGLENENGDYYHYTDRITKITKTELPVKQTLILACLGDTNSYGYPKEDGSFFAPSNKTYVCSDSLMDAIIRFNNSDPDYRIEVKPYIYSSDEERTRLLIELATGKEVDILDTSLLPDDAAGGSILADMLPYLDADADISRDDFIPGIFADMTKSGGLYEYIDRYNVITITARASFADGQSWTVSDIQQILAEHPELRIENSAEKLSYYFAWAASAEFIDYAAALCSFTDEAFLQWLVLIKQLCQTDYDWESDPYLGEYAFYIDTQFPANIGDMSRCYANGEYTAVGFPNATGTGSYFMRYGAPTAYGTWSYMPNGEQSFGAVSSVGIMASSGNIDGAWRFIKTFMSGAENTALSSGIPAQKACFERAVENELTREQSDAAGVEEFDESDAEQIRSIVYNTTKCVSNNDTVTGIIKSALDAYIGGVYSAEETAAQLQSRLSIYLAEQYG